MKSVRIIIYLLCLAISGTAAAQSVERGGSSAQPTKSNDDDFTSGWRLCNKTNSESVWVAYSYFENSEWITKGWRKIDQGDCSVFQTEITNQYAYYYASDFDGGTWEGDLNICAHETKKFEYSGEMGTCEPGYKVYPFYRWDFGDQKAVTRDLVPSAEETSSGDGFNSGWRLCNKTVHASVWVAYSYWENEDWVTKGWRKIDKGDCSVFQTEITNRYAYYYATNFDGAEWKGDLQLCAHKTEKFDYVGEMGTCKEGYDTYLFYKLDLDGQNGLTRDLVSE